MRDELADARQELYALMDEATELLDGDRTSAILRSDAWKAYKAAEKSAGDTRKVSVLRGYLADMRVLLDQIRAID